VAPHQVRHLEEHAAPRLRGHLAPRPRIERTPRRGDRRRDIVGRGLRDRRDRSAVAGLTISRTAARQDPRAVDEVPVMAGLCAHGDAHSSGCRARPTNINSLSYGGVNLLYCSYGYQ